MDVGVVDAPGSGGPAQVADGTLTLFVGGDEDVVARCEPLFAAYANQVVHFGPSGAGEKVKLVEQPPLRCPRGARRRGDGAL